MHGHIIIKNNDIFLNNNKVNDYNVSEPEIENEIKSDDYANNIKTITTKFYDRNPKLAEQCKEKAKNKCECCGRIIGEDKINNIPELQAHHKIPLSKGGEDNLNNLEALCPNCHRKKHIDMNSDEE